MTGQRSKGFHGSFQNKVADLVQVEAGAQFPANFGKHTQFAIPLPIRSSAFFTRNLVRTRAINSETDQKAL